VPLNQNFWFGWLPPSHPPTVGWIDDDELEEVHELLWHGYAPEPYQRHEWDFGAGGFGNPNPRPVDFRSERQLERDRQESFRLWRDSERRTRLAAEAAEAEQLWRRFPKGGLCFVCDGCRGRFTSPIPESEAELDYLRAFAGHTKPVRERDVYCEPCFDLRMKVRNARNTG